MLSLSVLSGVLTLLKLKTLVAYIVLGTVFIVSGTIFHEYGTNYMRAMQSDLHVILIIKSHICEYSDHGAKQIRVISDLVQLQHVQ